ncbi:unnamed protein product [Parascedosporium putredinis]|uniref:20S-pre-rRNA D-site endonuclease NOB1 n=1 Tax=Parascedosporium putredinis TaxID=1442378 RepID=A0A9P1H3M5_9PEZI|nr:unnamed protein product [Parascedosporium putredinis]CAI7994932.1 unnamed protein product [Parascedosporium putredinis]
MSAPATNNAAPAEPATIPDAPAPRDTAVIPDATAPETPATILDAAEPEGSNTTLDANTPETPVAVLTAPTTEEPSVAPDTAVSEGSAAIPDTVTSAQLPAAPQATVSSNDGKTVGYLVLDTGALIKNEPTVSTLLAQATELYTIPAVLAEIRDFITTFARKTGDLEVMSTPDIHLLALTYELECEQNGGDWRLRNNPTQKHLNGQDPNVTGNAPLAAENDGVAAVEPANSSSADRPDDSPNVQGDTLAESPSVEEQVENITLQDPVVDAAPSANEEAEQHTTNDQEDGDSDDSDGWITPSNLKKHVAKDQGASQSSKAPTQFLQAAILTTDYAMQNVALRINLNLLSSSMFRITRLRTYVLRCHGCFATTKDMTKQFCPRCGQPNLIRTSCSTDANGVFQIHLRKNFEYNKRGNVYSIPKPVHGTSSGKISRVQGGGRDGWGQSLVLAEDQKEYVRAKDNRRRTRQKDLMDQDYLPGILSGERTNSNDKVRVGAGRSVNSKKKW